MDQPAKESISSSCNHEETGMEQVLSDLHALERLYGLLHRGPAVENLDETSRALLMRMLDDATQKALLRQAKILLGSPMSSAMERKISVRSDRRTCDVEPCLSLRPLASPSPSLLASRAEEEESTPHRRRKDDDVSSAGWSSSRPRRTLNRIDSGSVHSSRSSSGAASSSPSTSPSVSPSRMSNRAG